MIRVFIALVVLGGMTIYAAVMAVFGFWWAFALCAAAACLWADIAVKEWKLRRFEKACSANLQRFLRRDAK